MTDKKQFDVIIIGGSYSGLAAAMSLARALKTVLVIDAGQPCNKQTPHSHNFITHDGKTPGEIWALAKEQVQKYDTVSFFNSMAINGNKTQTGFDIRTATGETFSAKKIILATGVKDLLPEIKGYSECWGISALHCPYCHGYEVRNEATGVLGNGEAIVEYVSMIYNWTKKLSLLTNGKSTLTEEQTKKLSERNIKIIDEEIAELVNEQGKLSYVALKNGSTVQIKALYAQNPFEHTSSIHESLGCKLTEDGYIETDPFKHTSVNGIYACGDNTTRMRTVASAIAAGNKAGMTASREIILEEF